MYWTLFLPTALLGYVWYAPLTPASFDTFKSFILILWLLLILNMLFIIYNMIYKEYNSAVEFCSIVLFLLLGLLFIIKHYIHKLYIYHKICTLYEDYANIHNLLYFLQELSCSPLESNDKLEEIINIMKGELPINQAMIESFPNYISDFAFSIKEHDAYKKHEYIIEILKHVKSNEWNTILVQKLQHMYITN